ncbi:MAG: M42 family metallopeptidase [Cellulosilyticaceae bacterium]
MNKQSIDMIESLSNAYGVSGFEDEVVGIIKDKFQDKFNIQEDAMRNLIIYRKNHNGSKPVIMLDGHSDEVGFIVHSIKANGTLKFLTLGGWTPQTVPAHKVMVRNEKGHYIPGVVATKPPHFNVGEIKMEPLHEMVIDIGATSYEEVIEVFGVEPGAPIVPDATFSYNEQTGMMLGKAFDNRLGCGCVLETLLALEGIELAVDVVGSISVQEEVGCRGAKVNTAQIKPDLAIVFEGSPADDTFLDRYEAQGVVKKGTQIRHFDKSFIANTRLLKLAKDIAKGNGIPYQSAVRIGGGTNAGPIHIEDKAVPCLVLGIPVRYAHTHYGFSAIQDYEASIKLAIEFMKQLDEMKLKSL